ncbi:hypothetical protein JD488_09955 [Aeromonas jandaei]|uniref:hypothetical protein n=1 Tax=Aeromonas TaxID=642 RepID=UPI00192020F8|nr:hypothetical protein [Aeromonas jandaei]MBL0667030.1 hypothetical protein [Aeromonas jandaei]
MNKPKKTDIQLAIFEDALQRLLRGEGKYVLANTKLSMAQLAKESGVGSGTLYYKPYSEFRLRADNLMTQYNSGCIETKHTPPQLYVTELQTLRNDRNNEKRLKEDYKIERDELKSQVKKLCVERVAVEHALFIAKVRIEELENMFIALTGQHPDDYHFKEGEPHRPLTNASVLRHLKN